MGLATLPLSQSTDKTDTTVTIVRPANIAEAWHLYSLDAPTVAALWSWCMARAVHVSLPLAAPVLLGIGTWLVYVADRLLDGWRGDVKSLRPRHLFYVQYRRAFVAAACAGGSVLIWLIATHMTARARHEDEVLSSAAVLYFVVIHGMAGRVERWLPKEMVVGALFAAAVAVPAWSRLNSGGTLLLPVVALFAVLCWLNCVAIQLWEQDNAVSMRANTESHLTTQMAGRHFGWAASSLAVVAASLAMSSWTAHRGVAALELAASAAGLMLALLHVCRGRFTAMQLRIGADAALLTAMLAWPLLR